MHAADMLMYLHITYSDAKLFKTSKAREKLRAAPFFADVLQRHNLPPTYLANLSFL